MHSRSPEIGLDALPTQILSWVHHEEPLNPIGLLFAFKWAGGMISPQRYSVTFMLFIWFLDFEYIIISILNHSHFYTICETKSNMILFFFFKFPYDPLFKCSESWMFSVVIVMPLNLWCINTIFSNTKYMNNQLSIIYEYIISCLYSGDRWERRCTCLSSLNWIALTCDGFSESLYAHSSRRSACAHFNDHAFWYYSVGSGHVLDTVYNRLLYWWKMLNLLCFLLHQ